MEAKTISGHGRNLMNRNRIWVITRDLDGRRVAVETSDPKKREYLISRFGREGSRPDLFVRYVDHTFKRNLVLVSRD